MMNLPSAEVPVRRPYSLNARPFEMVVNTVAALKTMENEA